MNASGIYAIKNIINNKLYIGKSVNLHKRENDHFSQLSGRKHHNRYLQRSWDKYGENNFKFNILEYCNEEKLNEKEIYYINKYNTNNAIFGYNLTKGGDGSQGFKHTEESKIKISKAQMGKKIASITRQKISDSLKGKTPKNINILLDYNIEQMKPIIQFNSNGELVKEWCGVNECARSLNIPATNLVKVLKENHKTCEGFTFFYKSDYENNCIIRDDIIERFKEIDNASKMIPVVQLNIDGKYIATWKSLECASKSLINGSKANISKCCKGIRKTHKGYMWKYKTEYENLTQVS